MVLYMQNSDSGSKKLLVTEHVALHGSFPMLPSQCQLLRVTVLKAFQNYQEFLKRNENGLTTALFKLPVF